jgi:DHA2 family multidrug resistance protein
VIIETKKVLMAMPWTSMGATDPAWLINLHKLEAAGLSVPQSVAAIGRQVVDQAYLLSTLDLFRISAWLMVILVPCVWLTNRSRGAGAGAHAAAD